MTLAWEHGHSKWHTGKVGLYMELAEHPITRGIPHFDLTDEIYHDLLQQGVYLGSLSTWYRQLRAAKESGDRRPQRAPQHHAVPRITARAANEAWTWDISKFPTR